VLDPEQMSPADDPGTVPTPGPRPELARELAAAREHSDALFALIRPEALYERAVAERHRFIFYVGHLEAFDWNLCRGSFGGDAPRSELDELFARGIDPDPLDPQALPRDQAADWPAAERVRQYGQERRRLLDARLGEIPEQLLHVAIEHRLMHAETLCYLLHWLRLDQKHLVAPPRPDGAPPPPASLIDVPAGVATLGQADSRGTAIRETDSSRAAFGWDNEFQQHQVEVPAFRIDRYKVTNGEYLRFVKEGGPVPLFWRPAPGGDGFLLRCMFGEIPLPPAWPVYATYEQASAYAEWAGRALPSEEQFHRAAYGTPEGTERAFPWGPAPPSREHGCFDFHGWDPERVDASPGGDSAFGVAQLCGNGWEWTRTPFAPFPGFRSFPFYPGYSADFFDGEHRVLKGGSARTAARLLRRSFRNWYRTNYRYVYAGFRCVDR
jgi:iron(II)-dependent oxidoreductase